MRTRKVRVDCWVVALLGALSGGTVWASNGGDATAQALALTGGVAVKARLTDEPATLLVWNRPIVTFRATLINSPQRRAEIGEQKILDLPASGVTVNAAPARIGGLEGILFVVGGNIAFTLVAEDIDPHQGETLETVTAQAVERLRQALDARERQANPGVVARAISESTSSTAVLVLVIWICVRVRRAWLRRIERSPGVLARVGVAGLDLGQHAIGLARRMIDLSFWGLRLFLVFLWIYFVLSRFPYSEPWARTLDSWLVEAAERLLQGTVESLPGLLTVAIIFVLARGLARVVGRLFQAAESGRLEVSWLVPETARATRRIASLLIWLFAVAFAYPFLPGASTSAFQGISVVAGLMLSLGSASLVNHAMSGMVIIYGRSARVGEHVRVGEVEGTVTHLGILSAKVRTHRGDEVTIPNAVFAAGVTTNHARLASRGGTVGATTVTIGYDAPWRLVHSMLELAALRTAGVQRTPDPRVLQRSLSDFFVEYELVVEIEPGFARSAVMSDLRSQIQDAFNENGVQILSPHFEAQPVERVVLPRSKWKAPLAEEGDRE